MDYGPTLPPRLGSDLHYASDQNSNASEEPPKKALDRPKKHQARQNISTLNFTAAFAKTSSSCNAPLEKCQHSLNSTLKRVKSQIQKGANPEKAAKRGYEQACEYLDLWNKTGLILQRELYSMGNTGLLRREAEMTLLQPHLGETRRQELRNSPFWHSSLF